MDLDEWDDDALDYMAIMGKIFFKSRFCAFSNFFFFFFFFMKEITAQIRFGKQIFQHLGRNQPQVPNNFPEIKYIFFKHQKGIF